MAIKTEKAEQKVDGRIVRKTLKLWVWSLLRFKFSWYYPGIPEIKPEEAFKLLQSDNPPLLIDIRDDADIMKFGKIEGTEMFPYFNFPAYIGQIPKDTKTKITICPGGLA